MTKTTTMTTQTKSTKCERRKRNEEEEDDEFDDREFELRSWTNNVVEERVCGLRRQRLDEVEKFTQQKDQLVLLVTVSQFLKEHPEEQCRFLDQAVPDHLLSHCTYFTHTMTRRKHYQ